MEGPAIARRIMAEVGLDGAAIEHVCRIVGSHHTAKDIDTLEFRIAWDADQLANMPEHIAGKSPDEIQDIIDRSFRTEKGRAIAAARYVHREIPQGAER